jgi:hypothetical protein
MIALFLSSYMIVLLLGLQSQLVRDKHVILSFFTSLGIGTCQLFLFKLAPDASIPESIAFILGGACGIVSSIFLHNFLLKFIKKK